MRCLGGQKWLKLDSKMSSIRGTSGLNSHTVYVIIWKLFFCKKKDANKNSSPCIQRRSLSLGAWRFIIVIILSYAIGRRQSFDITYHPKQRTAGLSKGAFHSTKYFCMKFPSQVITFQVSHVNTKQTKRKQENKNKPFLPFLCLLWSCSTTLKLKQMIYLVKSTMLLVNWVRDNFEGTIFLSFPDESNDEKPVDSRVHAHSSGSLHLFSHYLLKLVVANPPQHWCSRIENLKDRAEQLSDLSDSDYYLGQPREVQCTPKIQPHEVHQKFKLARYTKISEWNSEKCLFHSFHHLEFAKNLIEWKAP